MQVHVPACGVQTTLSGVIFRNILGDRVLHWLSAHQLGWSGWPVSSSHHLWFTGALVPAIVLDTFTWVLGLSLGPYAYKTSALPIKLSWLLELSFVEFLKMVQ